MNTFRNTYITGGSIFFSHFIQKGFCYSLFYFSFFILNTINGQESIWNIRPIAGISLNSVYSPNAWTYKFSPYLLGVEVERSITNRWALNTDFYFIRKGAHSQKDSGDREQDYRFDFIIINPNFNYCLTKKSDLKFILGIYGGIQIDAKAKFYPAETFSDYNPEGQNKFDFGLNTGLRKYILLGKNKLGFEPRFQLGLLRYNFTKQISFQLITSLAF